jgi:uncharacterized membrane protein YeaQ/YmgE (transglycosylase-associated protein family)
MFYLVFLFVYGLIIGSIAKFLHPGEDPIGCLPTVVIGIAGSYVGGFINFLLFGGQFLHTSGIIMGIVGGIVFLSLWRWWKLKSAPRSFWTGKIK